MATNIDYSTVSHQTIYQHITSGPGSTELMDASRGWQSVAAKLQELHKVVEEAIRKIGAAQQGAAADAATNATMALMPWLDGSVTAASGMAARISQQASSFEHTRDHMPMPVQVPEVSFSQDPGSWIGEHAVEWMPGIQTEHEQAQVAAQQAEQRARELMSGYQGTSNDNLALPQQFTAAPTVVADVADPAVGDGGASGGGSALGSPTHAGAAHPLVAHAAAAHAAAASPAGAATGHAGAVAPAATAAQVAPGSHPVPPAFTSSQLAGGYQGPVGQPVVGSGPAQPAAAAAFGPSPIHPGRSDAGGHRLRGGSRISGGGAAISRSGGFGPRPSAVLGEGHSQIGTAALTGGEHASAGRAARAGGGWEGAPFGATGGSGRDGKAEHRRPSYLIEHDTNAIVGELPPVAPPVIGGN